MHVVNPDNSRRDDVASLGDDSRMPSNPAPSDNPLPSDSSRSALLISTDKITADALESELACDSDIPDLLEPYRLVPDDYIASLSTTKERKEAKEKQRRRAKRRAALDKQLSRYAKKHPQVTPEEVFRAVFPKAEKKRTKKKRPLVPIVAMLLGAILLAFPIVSDVYANWQAEQAITSYTQQLESMAQEEKDEMMAQAIAYNHRLAGEVHDDHADIDDVDYNDIADTTGTGIMGAIMIECIGVNQPIYHGTDEDTLMAGVGHMEGTSFPIPTGSTHAAIAGHTGMPGQRMFDELVDLEPGDKLHIKILDENTWYQVVSSEVVDPDQKNTFAPEEGRDLLTLITCTPYGINDHRLLVHCEKIDIEQNQSDFGVVTEDKMSKYINLRTLPVIITAALLALGIIWKLMKLVRNNTGKKKVAEQERKRKKEAALEHALIRGSAKYAENTQPVEERRGADADAAADEQP